LHYKHLVQLRAQKVHISAIVLMNIIQALNDRTHSAYVGEITASYSKYDPNNYTYGGVYSMLRTLVKRELVLVEKVDNYNNYSLSTAGFDLVYKML